LTRLAALPALADSDAGKGSPIGLLVVLLLIVAVYFLYRSMNRHLRKIPGEFGRPERSAPDTQPPDAHPSTLDSQLPAPDTYPPTAEPSPPTPKQPEQDR
jgi:hypothetical protein